MNKRLLITFILLFTCHSFLLAQSNFQKGYIITSKNDTLQGFIDYKEWSKNPDKIRFKSMLSGQDKTLTKENISYFEVTDREAYNLFIVSISTDEVELAKLSTGKDTSSIIDTVFLKIIDKGDNITTFSYHDNIKTRFFVLDKNKSVPEELIYKRFFDPKKQSILIEQPLYRNQLFLYARQYNIPDENRVRPKFESAKYILRDIQALSRIINAKGDEKAVKRQRNFYPFAGISLNRNTTSYTGDHPLAENANSKTSFLPAFSAGIDAYFNPHIGRLLFRGELSLAFNNADISKTDNPRTYSHSFSQVNLVLSPQFIYNIYNTPNLKFNIGSGVNANFSTYSNNNYTQTFHGQTAIHKNSTEFRKFWYSFPLRAGMVVNKRFEVMALYTPPLSMTNYLHYSIATSSLRVGINYLFKRNKIGI